MIYKICFKVSGISKFQTTLRVDDAIFFKAQKNPEAIAQHSHYSTIQ